MVIKITNKEINLTPTKKGFEYSFNTAKGSVKGSGFESEEKAREHAENNLVIIVKSLIKLKK